MIFYPFDIFSLVEKNESIGSLPTKKPACIQGLYWNRTCIRYYLILVLIINSPTEWFQTWYASVATLCILRKLQQTVVNNVK